MNLHAFLVSRAGRYAGIGLWLYALSEIFHHIILPVLATYGAWRAIGG